MTNIVLKADKITRCYEENGKPTFRAIEDILFLCMKAK